PPVAALPDVGLDAERLGADLEEVQPARLAATVRPRLPEPRGDRDCDAALAAGRDLELPPLAHRRLVDVPGEDELRARVDERAEDVVAARNRLLPRPPGCADQVVVEDGDQERAVVRLAEEPDRGVELALAQAARLVPPRPDGVQADDVQQVRAV